MSKGLSENTREKELNSSWLIKGVLHDCQSLFSSVILSHSVIAYQGTNIFHGVYLFINKQINKCTESTSLSVDWFFLAYIIKLCILK